MKIYVGGENMVEVFYYDYVTIKPWTYFLTASRFGLTYVGLKGDKAFLPFLAFILTECLYMILKN